MIATLADLRFKIWCVNFRNAGITFGGVKCCLIQGLYHITLFAILIMVAILSSNFLSLCFPQNSVSREAQTMILVDHPNVLKSHCSFVTDHNLWVVMPYMAGGSCLHILKAAYPDGFEEVVIATILREVLKGLDYLHHHGHIHRDVKVSVDTPSEFGYSHIEFPTSLSLSDFASLEMFIRLPCMGAQPLF